MLLTFTSGSNNLLGMKNGWRSLRVDREDAKYSALRSRWRAGIEKLRVSSCTT